MAGVTYDTGALIAAERNDRRIWTLHRRALERGMMPTVSSGVGLRPSCLLQAGMAEVDGNRTRRTGIARPTRFEGGGAHQALGHLRQAG